MSRPPGPPTSTTATRAVMCGVTLVVVVLSVRASRQPSTVVLGAQPAGVVAGALAPSTTAPSSQPLAWRSPSKHARKKATARPAATRRTSPTTAARSPRPRPRPVTAAPTPTTMTVNGSAVDTPYGPVQVQIDLRNGHIVAARALEYPNGTSNDQQINGYAIPQLNDEAVQADSANIDTVSGATYTSEGYIGSLQSALDAAHRAGAR